MCLRKREARSLFCALQCHFRPLKNTCTGETSWTGLFQRDGLCILVLLIKPSAWSPWGGLWVLPSSVSGRMSCSLVISRLVSFLLSLPYQRVRWKSDLAGAPLLLFCFPAAIRPDSFLTFSAIEGTDISDCNVSLHKSLIDTTCFSISPCLRGTREPKWDVNFHKENQNLPLSLLSAGSDPQFPSAVSSCAEIWLNIHLVPCATQHKWLQIEGLILLLFLFAKKLLVYALFAHSSIKLELSIALAKENVMHSCFEWPIFCSFSVLNFLVKIFNSFSEQLHSQVGVAH